MGLTQKLGTIPLAVFTDSSNNVGIGGAANASFKLQVTGTTNLVGALSGTSATFSGTIATSGGNITTNGGTIAAFNNGGIELYNTSNAAYARLVSISGSFNVNVNNNSTTALSIASTGAATFSSSVTALGNVLIGTSTAPSAIGVNDLLVIGKSGSASNAINFSNGSTTNWGYILAESGKMVFGSGSSSNITFETNAGSERMRITSGGDILYNGSTTSGNAALFQNDASFLKFFAGNSGSSTKGITFNVSNGGGTPEAMRITSAGTLGIGITNPTSTTKLMVAGGIGFGNNTDGQGNLSYGGRISAKATTVTGGAGATLIHRGLGSVGYFIMVSGLQGSNRFIDLIYGTSTVSPSVLASSTGGTSAPTRTYTQSGENIFLSLSGGDAWTITTTGLGAMES